MPTPARISQENALSSSHLTMEGNDQLPAWYLRLLAPVISHVLEHIINYSVTTSHEPTQWKLVLITPKPKIAVSPE